MYTVQYCLLIKNIYLFRNNFTVADPNEAEAISLDITQGEKVLCSRVLTMREKVIGVSWVENTNMTECISSLTNSDKHLPQNP